MFQITDLTGPEVERIAAALEAIGGLVTALGSIEDAIEALTPGLVTTSQRGMLAPASFIENGMIKDASASNKGLMLAADKNKVDNPDLLIFAEIAALQSAAYRNAIPRGKNLGTFTGTMSDCIRAGDFKGLAIGDTFKYSSRAHTIAHFDPDIRCGDNVDLGHHIAVISDGGWSSKWNETNNTVTGGVNGGAGYVDSTVRAYIKSSGGPQDQIIGDFGSGHVLSYRALYPSTYNSSGQATGWAWVDAKSELLNETQVYGHQVWGQNGYEDGIDKFQLAIFRLMPSFMNTRAYWWLRSVVSATAAASVYGDGSAASYGASYSFGVRPLSLIA